MSEMSEWTEAKAREVFGLVLKAHFISHIEEALIEAYQRGQAVKGRRLFSGAQYLDTNEAAEVLGVSAGYLKKLRNLGRGPMWKKFGPTQQHPIKYFLDDIHIWYRSLEGGGGCDNRKESHDA